MAWMILFANGEELQRLDLDLLGPVVVGRSPECDVAVRDVLLSRTHCRIEPFGTRGAWRIVDLGSRNGTRVGWEQVQTHVLRDGDWLRAGRTRMLYHSGRFVPPADVRVRPDRLVRPADPHEALTGTVTDFVLLDEEDPADDVVNNEDGLSGLPVPQPRPLDPSSYHGPVVTSLLDDLASSYVERDARPEPAAAPAATTLPSTTSALALAALPDTTPALARRRSQARPLPRVLPPGRPIYREVANAAVRPPRAADEADLALQADPRHLPAAVRIAPVDEAAPLGRRCAVAAVWTLALAAGTAIVGMSAWLLTLAP